MKAALRSPLCVFVCLVPALSLAACGGSAQSEVAGGADSDKASQADTWATGMAATKWGGHEEPMGKDARIVFLHHSTGEVIWNGGVAGWFEKYNSDNDTNYEIVERVFPKDSPYGWENYPYDYWNIWVRHAGDKPFEEEPTLEILTDEYDVIVFKHCFPVSDVEQDHGEADVSSPDKRTENYTLQYEALKEKMRQFAKSRFIVWTGAAQAANCTDPETAKRAKAFFDWVKGKWDEPGDNIFVWDFHELETEGGLYLKDKYAADPYDSHPNETFARKAAPLLCRRIVDVVEGRGDKSSITGQ